MARRTTKGKEEKVVKGKKEKLSVEELLKQALVNEEDKPYEVPGNWVWTRLGCVCRTISKGTTPKGGKDSYTNKGIGFLRVENIDENGAINLNTLKFIDDETHFKFLKRSILEADDIIISIAGTLGRTAIIKKDHLPLNTNQAICFVRLLNKEFINVKYVEKVLSSPTIQRLLTDQTKVTSIPNLTLKIISDCIIPIPPLPEQQRIVNLIESLFEKLDRAKELCNVIDKIDLMKKSILARAFRGELNTNNPEEESALELLKEVLRERMPG